MTTRREQIAEILAEYRRAKGNYISGSMVPSPLPFADRILALGLDSCPLRERETCSLYSYEHDGFFKRNCSVNVQHSCGWFKAINDAIKGVSNG